VVTTTSEADALAVARWVAAHPLDPVEVDCAITVMLKILDGKCKMAPEEKRLMAALYDAVRLEPAQRFGAAEHALIAEGRAHDDEALRLRIYEHRVLAESMISRPVMKTFKARIRAHGLFDTPTTETTP
jgi:hypothetical protein